MRFSARSVTRLTLIGWMMMGLSGCGDSVPESSAANQESATPAAKVASAPQPSLARAEEVTTNPAQGAKFGGSGCNLDAINGAGDFEQPLRRSEQAVLSGWVSNDVAGTVPDRAQLVLVGENVFVLNIGTGFPRPDVAQVKHNPALVAAGFAVKADLSSVTPGRYNVELAFPVGTEGWACHTGKAIAING